MNRSKRRPGAELCEQYQCGHSRDAHWPYDACRVSDCSCTSFKGHKPSYPKPIESSDSGSRADDVCTCTHKAKQHSILFSKCNARDCDCEVFTYPCTLPKEGDYDPSDD